jgi:cation diffusion facilitator CzcD-associated flavoprotein CzcO
MTVTGPPRSAVDQRPTLPRHVRVAIVGAGFGGLAAAKALREAGITDLVILERRDGLGGTWWDNTYPGVACDIPSHLYSFSFAPNPDWSRTFASGPEIQQYLEQVTDRFDLRGSIRFGTSVTSARWQDDECRWRLSTSDGDLSADILVAATGPLSQPSVPKIPGLAEFPGQAFHTAAWRSDVDLTGKRVAVVGTGASAVQVVPKIQPQVATLTLFQRTPPWVLRKGDRRISNTERAAFRRFPALQRLVRAADYLSREIQVGGFVGRPAVMKLPQRLALLNLARQIRDPQLRAKVTPSYRFGCKRVTPSNRYYPALAQPNVTVVPAALERVEGQVLVGSDGSRQSADVIVLATGFAVTDPALGRLVTGRDGRTLAQAWQQSGLQALRGTTIAGFPNLFTMIGPNTGLGHNSMVYMIESQLPYLVGAIRAMDREQIAAIEPTAAAQQRWNDRLQGRMPNTVWMSGGCVSWYQDAAGRVTTLWPYSTLRFRRELRRFDPHEYTRIRRPAQPVHQPVHQPTLRQEATR